MTSEKMGRSERPNSLNFNSNRLYNYELIRSSNDSKTQAYQTTPQQQLMRDKPDNQRSKKDN